MKLETKTAPRVGDSNIDRVISKIYKDINEIINSLNQKPVPHRNDTSGKSGDIRLSQKGKSLYVIEGRFSDGWAETNMTLKEK